MREPWILKPGQHPQLLKQPASASGDIRFQLFLPKGSSTADGRKWPLIVFLHGSGERGNDVEKVKVHGPPKIVETNPDFPFILVSPLAAANTDWSSKTVNALLNEVIERLPVDVERIYLTGMSRGGRGTWRIAAENTARFAAIIYH